MASKPKFKKLLILVITAFIVGLLLLVVYYQSQLTPVSANKTSYQNFIITPGQSVEQISQNLKKQEIIKNALAFRIFVQLSRLTTKLQAGSYQLSASDSVKVIAKKLTQGFTDVWITLPEGSRIEEIADKLVEVLSINRQDFLENAVEGYMFPDTYRIPKLATGRQIAKMMRDNFDSRFDKIIQAELIKSGLTQDQLIILASIIEREVKFVQDRPIVVGILLTRLDQGIPLETDATVQYAVGFDQQEKSYWKRNLTADDLKIDSPYNTRKFAGLPPGPICNPGLAVIQSVLNPQKTDYLYYLSDSSGRIYYAKTLEEHIANINKYL